MAVSVFIVMGSSFSLAGRSDEKRSAEGEGLPHVLRLA